MRHTVGHLTLIPFSDVCVRDGRTISLGPLPWMWVDVPAAQWAGRWVSLVFEASVLDPLTRPVLRFVGAEGRQDHVLPAPVFGSGAWIGQIPPGTREILVSPADWSGPFSFRFASLKPIGFLARLIRGLRRHPKKAVSAVWAGLRGNLKIERSRMRLALGATPLPMYRKWRSDGVRPIEWEGLDAPFPWERIMPRICLMLVDIDEAEYRIWSRLARSQPNANVTLLRVCSQTDLLPHLAPFDATDLVAAFQSGDRLTAFALMAVLERALHEPACLYYADEETPAGPRFKPDWSPIFARFGELLGRAWFARIGFIQSISSDASQVGDLLKSLPVDTITYAVHIRRLLLSSKRSHTGIWSQSKPQPEPARIKAGSIPLATIIIPTRDRLDLLAPCLDSLRQKTADDVFEVIIVDNDSVETETIAYLENLVLDVRFKVVAAPGTFNFSALCNRGALAARAETIVFLNNDIEVISRDWLTHLLHWAKQPDIGAVGAKLVYADNTIQHGGVVLGIDGRAAHFERNLEAAAAGFFGRLGVPHELSAVTAACFAVSAVKFQSVNGFDEHNLPVDLSDIDLCLRLGERGWRTVLDPRAVLRHHESASRGKKQAPEELYRKEIAYFKARWVHALRNDPYFHPALSLDWFRPALG